MKRQQIGLRLRKPLHERLKAAAKAEDRSLNAEIVARLDLSFAMEDGIRAWLIKMLVAAPIHQRPTWERVVIPAMNEPGDGALKKAAK